MADNATPDVPVPWEVLNGVTWVQLREATYLAEMALKGLADAEWIVPSMTGARVQELHGWSLHVILEVVEGRLFS